MKNTIIAIALITTCSLQGQRLMPIGSDNDVAVEDMIVIDDELYFGGNFDDLMDQEIYGFGKWNGTDPAVQLGHFNSTGDRVYDFLFVNNELIVAYRFEGNDHVGRLIGDSLHAFGDDFGDQVSNIVEFNGELYAAGEFNENDGDSTVTYVAKWDGVSWNQVGQNLYDDVKAIVVHDDQLYIGGEFNIEDGAPVDYIAKLEDGSWSSLDVGLNNDVEDLESTPSGLWIVGNFDSEMSETVVLNGSAIWDGTSFSPLSTITDFSSCAQIYIINVPNYGNMISSSYTCGTTLNPGLSTESKIRMARIKSAIEYNGITYVGGNFGHGSYEGFNGIGKLMPGTETGILNIAGISAKVNVLGNFNNSLYDYSINNIGFEVPAGSNLKTIFATEILATGSENGIISNTFFDLSYNNYERLASGPWAIEESMEYHERYFQVWPMSKENIENHNDNTGISGYEVPYNISSWPTEGDISNGEAPILAPFEDFNNNGEYEPAEGELPQIKGDQAVLSLRSDLLQSINLESSATGVDVFSMTYGYETEPGDPLYQVLFSNHQITNRSGHAYDSLYLMVYTDFDIGNPDDDYIGTDVDLNMVYGYNWDNMDQDGNPPVLGYGENPPAQGTMVLNHNITASINPNFETGFSELPNLYNMAQGLRWDGVVQLDQDSIPTTFTYTGDPSDLSQWSEVSNGFNPGDRRIMMSVGPFLNVAPEETFCLDLAYVYARDPEADHIANVTLLKQRASAVQDWYDSNALACGEYTVTSVKENDLDLSNFTLLPNPASEYVNIQHALNEKGDLKILDLTGRLIYSQKLVADQSSIQIDLNHLVPGTYLISIESKNSKQTKRLVVSE